MEKEPIHVCSSLFHRLSQDTSIEITSTFRQYFCHSKKVDDSVRTSVSQHFIQLLNYNHQVHNRLLDDLIACLPYLSIIINIIVLSNRYGDYIERSIESNYSS